MVVLFSGLAGLFLILTLVSIVMNKKPADLMEEKSMGIEGRELGICGNGLCENNLGETRESCPQDCSAGD